MAHSEDGAENNSPANEPIDDGFIHVHLFSDLSEAGKDTAIYTWAVEYLHEHAKSVPKVLHERLSKSTAEWLSEHGLSPTEAVTEES